MNVLVLISLILLVKFGYKYQKTPLSNLRQANDLLVKATTKKKTFIGCIKQYLS
jgi:hypothetical protein